jgi:CHC2 zinc finger
LLGSGSLEHVDQRREIGTMKSKTREASDEPNTIAFGQAGRLKYAIFFSGHLQKFKLGNARINARALCPFHDDNELSFSVNINTGHGKCHACGVKGDLKGFCKRKRISLPAFAIR